jgi:hypothetical protein
LRIPFCSLSQKAALSWPDPTLIPMSVSRQVGVASTTWPAPWINNDSYCELLPACLEG